MIDLLSTVQGVLQNAKFSTRLVDAPTRTALCFEDENVMGFACAFEQAQSLLSEWRQIEGTLLQRYSRRFREAGDKAWNVYLILVTGALASDAQAREIRWIEEDLMQTRKITGLGVMSREQLTNVLLPLLPLQYHAVLPPGESVERLQRRIGAIAPKAADAVLNENISVEEVVKMLGDQP